MQKIKEQINHRIGEISIWAGSISLLAHVLMLLSDKLSFLQHFQVVYIYDYVNTFFRIGGNTFSTRFPFSPVTILFFIMLIVGGILYQKTKTKDSRLLRFCYSSVFIQKIFIIIFLPLSYYQNKQFQSNDALGIKYVALTNVDFAVTAIFSSIILVFSFLTTKWLMSDQKIKLEETVKSNGTLIFTAIKPSLDKRFVHFFFDKVLALIFVAPVVFSLSAMVMMVIDRTAMNSI